MKILLCCSAGMSTSLLVAKMQKLSSDPIEAISLTSLDERVDEFDLVLLGPQVGFKLGELQKTLKVPVEKIPAQLYGMMDAQAVLNLAATTYNNYHQENKGE